MFAVALACWVIAVLGLRSVDAADTGRGRRVLSVWAAAIALIAAGSLISLSLRAFVSDSDAVYDNNPLMPIGGLLSLVAPIIAGIAIARAGRWSGWSRWAVPGHGLYFLGALFIPVFLGANRTQ